MTQPHLSFRCLARQRILAAAWETSTRAQAAAWPARFGDVRAGVSRFAVGVVGRSRVRSLLALDIAQAAGTGCNHG